MIAGLRYTPSCDNHVSETVSIAGRNEVKSGNPHK